MHRTRGARAGHHAWALSDSVGLLCLLAAGCVDAEPIEPTLRVDGRASPAGSATNDNWVFADGATVGGLVLPTTPVAPGSITLQLHVSAPGLYEVTVAPPRQASRQVARGGPDAPPWEVPPDPRTRQAQVRVERAGLVTVTVELPPPWHPKTAVVTVARTVGGRRIPVVSGPRRAADGQGILAVVPVASLPTSVHAKRVAKAPSVDGGLGESLWNDAAWTTLNGSLQGEPVRLGATREDLPAWPPTQVAFAWDDAALYVAARLPDDDIRATFREHDDPIWKEEVFEVFVFGDDSRARYVELQVSPRGVRFDARFEVYRKGDEAWDSAFEARVEVDGTIEDPSDVDRGWTAELRIPWQEICEQTEVVCPVAAGTALRIGAFRLERPRKGATVGLALSPTRVPDFHAPQNAAVLHLVP